MRPRRLLTDAMGTSRHVGDSLKRAFAQPEGQRLPDDILALLVELHRSHDEPRDEGPVKAS